jgi:hypothetical protein
VLSNKLLLTGVIGVCIAGVWLKIALSEDSAESASATGASSPNNSPATPGTSRKLPSQTMPAAPTVPTDPGAAFALRLRDTADRNPGRTFTPTEARREVLDQLARSGISNEEWTTAAPAIYSELATQLRQALPASANLEMSFDTCFAAGCVAHLSYSNRTDFRLVAQKLGNAGATTAWAGPKMATPAEQINGRQQSDFILLRP